MKDEADWAILLDLFMCASRGQPRAVNDACTASGAPSSTALRRVERLQALGIVVRSPDPSDRRRSLLVLSDPVRARVSEHFQSAANSQPITGRRPN